MNPLNLKVFQVNCPRNTYNIVAKFYNKDNGVYVIRYEFLESDKEVLAINTKRKVYVLTQAFNLLTNSELYVKTILLHDVKHYQRQKYFLI